jgi:hypothetical protein
MEEVPMTMHGTVQSVLVSFAVLCLASVVLAAPYVPPGLTAGDPYHLVFVTRDTRDAASTLIGDYDAFVQGQAALNPVLTGTNVGVQYGVIGSTAAADAFSHASVAAPVYNFNGDKVADNAADLWDGTLDNAILYDQFVNFGFPDVYTGTDSAGAIAVGSALGDPSPRTGLASVTTALWIDDSNVGQTTPYSFYALSEPLAAPGDSGGVPEPATALLVCVGLLWVSRHARRG